MARKGQAAMEFLMTYGWAILVVLIAIGALAYFGVLNPARFLPNSCTLFPGLACTEFKVDASEAKVQLFMRNGIGDSISVASLTIESAPGVLLCTGPTEPVTPGVVIGDGALTNINATVCATGAAASRFKADIAITYVVGTSGLSHTRTGALVAQVEP